MSKEETPREDISQEIKAKAISPYLGQNIVTEEGETLELISISIDPLIGYRKPYLIDEDGGDEAEISMDSYWKLLLKPISSITDEHAIEVMCFKEKTLKGFEVVKIWRYEKHMTVEFKWISDGVNNADGFSYSGNGIGFRAKDLTVEQYQMIVNFGYDIENYHLNGKTLKEAGLAIYE